IDECRDGTHKCSFNARCTNTDGSYTCSCSSGFQGDGMSCGDSDECAEGVHDCHGKAVCTNTPGSYRCSCSKGYHGNGKQCKASSARRQVPGNGVVLFVVLLIGFILSLCM
ncbi:hypothetical protein OS493_026760, partial [Desmophyllum pertusum]